MDQQVFGIDRLAAELRRVCSDNPDEKEILATVRELARRAAASKQAWLKDYMYEADAEQGFGVHLLHEEPDHTLAVFAVSWLPDRGTMPHDHGTWAVVVGIDGPERNEFWKRSDDRSRPGHAELKKAGRKVFVEDDVLAMPAGTIHSVWNETDRVTVSLHIYGKHVNHTGRSQYDPGKRTETPFQLKIV
ncbi:MAG TPA: cysteine dioxygenase family protein [Burkholderiales bacterium]|nr:cysteine dioxygenase family protein [Burkholderiales bacterium]